VSRTSTRRLAVDALVRIEDGAFAHVVVPEMLRRSGLAPRDRGFVTEMVYGTVRMQRALDFQLDKVASQPMAKVETVVRAALRLGAYQLMIGVSEHAAVSETVSALADRQRGFVNGVLRGLVRARPWTWPSGTGVAALGVRTSHPDWIVELLVEQFGATDALATLALADEPAPVTLRVDPDRAGAGAVEQELRAAGVDVQRGALVRDALVLTDAGDIGALAAVRDGRATPQDQASQAVAAIVDAQPGDRVLDLAAAPGGKAGAIAARVGTDGVVVAADIHAGRVRLLQRGMERLDRPQVRAVVADGRNPPVRPEGFERVLLDAPCSGLGVLRRRPDARWRVQPEDVDALAVLQREMLVTAATTLRPGGRLVYAVCTLTDAETIGADEFAARELPQLRAAPRPDPPWRAHGRGALLLPSDARTDGMYVLALERHPSLTPNGAARPG
jgi:16S rRNA (cytosine967-C5)-methyltransferase